MRQPIRILLYVIIPILHGLGVCALPSRVRDELNDTDRHGNAIDETPLDDKNSIDSGLVGNDDDVNTSQPIRGDYSRVDDAIMLLLTGEVKDLKQDGGSSADHHPGNSGGNPTGEKEITESIFAETKGRLIPSSPYVHQTEPDTAIDIKSSIDSLTGVNSQNGKNPATSKTTATKTESTEEVSEKERGANIKTDHNRYDISRFRILEDACRVLNEEKCKQLAAMMVKAYSFRDITDDGRKTTADHVTEPRVTVEAIAKPASEKTAASLSSGNSHNSDGFSKTGESPDESVESFAREYYDFMERLNAFIETHPSWSSAKPSPPEETQNTPSVKPKSLQQPRQKRAVFNQLSKSGNQFPSGSRKSFIQADRSRLPVAEAGMMRKRRTRRAVISLPGIKLPDDLSPEMLAVIEKYQKWRQMNGYGKQTARWG